MVLAVLAVLGLIAGSFINALVWRLHEGKNWLNARSQCPACGHQLAAKDLVPVLSFLALRGHCRCCKKSISPQYPLVELATATWFALSYAFWPAALSSPGQITLLVTWLVVSVGLIALVTYDLLWMILPNKIIYPTLAAAVAGQAVYSLAFAPHVGRAFLSWIASLLVSSGIFFVLHEVSRGQWIGFGDVRLGLITGTMLADPAKALLMIFVASILGIGYGLIKVFKRQRTLSDRIPYGPFLILGAGFALIFGHHIISWYISLVHG